MLFAITRFIYTIFMLLALPAIVARLFWKSCKLPAYRNRILERFGIYKNCSIKPNGFLIHAVSVGEVVAALPLIKALQTQYPDMQITITTTTPTGSQRVQQSLKNNVAHVYMAYDVPWLLERLQKKVRPSCVIIMETEIWPNLYHMCQKHHIPLLIANGRISDLSLPKYVRIKFFIAQILQQVTMVAAQSRLDADRFLQLGLPANKLQVAGNLKFDVQVNEAQLHEGQHLKAKLANRLVWVAASTHEGEEEQVLAAFKQIQKKFPNCLLILIPRHPDRFNAVADLLAQQQVNFIRRSEKTDCTEDIKIMLGDTMGELGMFYAIADVAFVGGSLVPIGGHNLLEPSALGVPSITGPNVENFVDIAMLLQQAGALSMIHNANELAQSISLLLESQETRQQIGAKALQVVMQNRGAIKNIMQSINYYLPEDTNPLVEVEANY